MAEQNSPIQSGSNVPTGAVPSAQSAPQVAPQGTQVASVAQPGAGAPSAQPNAAAPAAQQAQTAPVSAQVAQASSPTTSAQPAQTPVAASPTTLPPQPFVPYHNGQPVLQRPKNGNNTALVVGVVICVIVAILVVGIVAIMYFRPDIFFGAANYEKPTTSAVKEAFEDATIPEPDLSNYMYIGNEDLDEAELSDFEAGEVTISSNMPTCIVSARAKYENTSVKVEETLNIRMEHPKDAESWSVAGAPTQGDLHVTPLGPADFKQIKDNFFNILREYDSDVAAQFVNAEIQVEANLNINGGTAVFTLKKPVEGSEEVKECTVNTEISWSDSKGWDVKITSIDGLEEPGDGEQAPAEGDANAPQETPGGADSSGGTSQGGSSGNPTMELEAWSGDLVQVPGTVRFSNGHILLQADYVIRVIFDGRVYITSWFELGAGGSSVTTLTNGAHILATGEMSATGTLPQAPLVINLDYD